jgi:CubicO group peptidase (beta-lactamase class C family)
VIVYATSSGYADVDHRVPMTLDTRLRIASMTKPITSVALMMLYEEGLFQLTDPISKFLPAYEKTQVSTRDEQGKPGLRRPRRPISIRHVLTHTAGFASDYRPKNRDAYLEAARIRQRDEKIGDFVDRLASVPLSHEPGEVWDYSRATCVVGRLVEVLSGLSLADFFEQRIFTPLGMTDTHFFLPKQKLPRFAAAYAPGEGKRIRPLDAADEQSFWLSEPGVYDMGSGGLVSTAADYFRFADMLMQGGRREGVRILGRKTVELMTRSHIGDRHVWLTGPGYGFGLGFAVALDRGRSHSMPSEGSYTWGGAYCTHWWNDPSEQLFGMALTQVRPYAHLNLSPDFQSIATAAIDD